MSRESTVSGQVTRGGHPVEGAYLSLKGASGEFVGGIRTDETGRFQFYATPGDWTLELQLRTGRQTKRVALARGDEQQVEFEA